MFAKALKGQTCKLKILIVAFVATIALVQFSTLSTSIELGTASEPKMPTTTINGSTTKSFLNIMLLDFLIKTNIV